MATILRPVKTYGTRTYVGEVAAAPANEDPILANEVDADLDTVYAAWNAGVDTINIKDGAVTNPKLGDSAVTGTKIAPATIDRSKLTLGATVRGNAWTACAETLVNGTTPIQFAAQNFPVQGGIVLVLGELAGVLISTTGLHWLEVQLVIASSIQRRWLIPVQGVPNTEGVPVVVPINFLDVNPPASTRLYLVQAFTSDSSTYFRADQYAGSNRAGYLNLIELA